MFRRLIIIIIIIIIIRIEVYQKYKLLYCLTLLIHVRIILCQFSLIFFVNIYLQYDPILGP